MISKTIKQIVDQLNNYLNTVPNLGTDIAVMGHLNSDSFSSDSDSKIVVNLINIEEDKVYKNHITPLPPNSGNTGVHPQGGFYSMRINLYLLFAFNPGASSGQYEYAITCLTHVLRYFQGTQLQKISIPIINTTDTLDFDLEMCYHNISLEDSNNMWSNLGGEQKPYAMYQAKLLEIKPDENLLASLVPNIQETKLSSPQKDSDGNTIFNLDPPDGDGSPIGDTNEIKHINN